MVQVQPVEKVFSIPEGYPAFWEFDGPFDHGRTGLRSSSAADRFDFAPRVPFEALSDAGLLTLFRHASGADE